MSTGVKKRIQMTSVTGVRVVVSTLTRVTVHWMGPSRRERGWLWLRRLRQPEPGQPVPADPRTRGLATVGSPGPRQQAWLIGVGVPAQPGGGLGFACMGCADLRNQLADALRLAYTDELTCLPNRRALYREMDERAQVAEVYGLAFLDVDGFKAINDVHGHATGDWVLFQLAARLRQLSDQRGWLAARLGGDEFAVLLPAMSIEDAVAAAHDIHECFSEPITLPSARVFPSATVGVTVAAASEPPRNVRHRADVAMYQAKGRDPGVGRSGPHVGLTPVRTRGKL